MKYRTNNTGFAIALAWPATYCKQPGSWYDPLMLRMGISMNHYYRVGHAALVLVDTENLKCHYFDFGRYHAPFKHGRVRSFQTDHELRIETTPHIPGDNKSIENFREILNELQMNKACHGEGALQASYCRVNFQSAFNKAEDMQNAGAIPYGPFSPNGSNCSRFVNTVIRAGNPGLKHDFRLKYMRVLTPTPMNNVNALNQKTIIPIHSETTPFIPILKPDRKALVTTLPAPERNDLIPENAQWLSGEGAGSWFAFNSRDSYLEVTRYSPAGIIECKGLYKNQDGQSDIPERSYRINYPSNCKVVSLLNGSKGMRFERIP